MSQTTRTYQSFLRPRFSVITTEHFALQGSRSATISESAGRASMFLSAVSGGLVALGLIATAARLGSAFYIVPMAGLGRPRRPPRRKRTAALTN